MSRTSLGFKFLILGVFLFTLLDFVGKAEATRALFVFGDSLVDNGNNNYLATTARADRPPYGIDYPPGPTGRFSNGLNIPDFISQELGSEPTLPYLSPELTGEKLLVGANFASAGIGILNDTGIQFVNIIRMFQQFEYFEQYQRRVSALIGEEQMQRLVAGALVLICVGGNDFVNNYFLVPYSLRSQQFSIPNYVTYLLSEYKKLLMRLYDLGARRVLVLGTGPIGCVPAQLAQGSRNGECVAAPQRAAALYNPGLDEMLQNLNSEYGDNIFISGNVNEMQSDYITNPSAYGFETSQIACCGQGRFNGVGLCTAISNVCPNREIYAWWDPYHPTERANRIIVGQIMTGSTKYMNPINLSTVIALGSKF